MFLEGDGKEQRHSCPRRGLLLLGTELPTEGASSMVVCFKRDKTIKLISNSLISFPGLGDKNNNEVGQFHIHRL